MTNTDTVLPPLPHADPPTGKSADEDIARALTDDGGTRELSPDVPPAGEYEGAPPLIGSPMTRGGETDGTRGLEPDNDVRDKGDIDVIGAPATSPAPTTPTIDPSEKQAFAAGVTRRELAQLKKEITALYGDVAEKLAASPAKTALALGWLAEARAIGLGRVYQYPIAELRLFQTRTLLRQYTLSLEASQRNARGLVSVNLIWLALFGLLFFVDLWLRSGGAAFGFPAISLYFPPWLCVLAGGLGGALASLVTLGQAFSRREYNPDDNLDFQLNAAKGAVLGGVVYYVILGGFITAAATSGMPMATESGAGANDTLLLSGFQQGASQSPFFILLAFIAGMAQPRLLSLLGRIWSERTGDHPAPATATQSSEGGALPPFVTPIPVPANEEGDSASEDGANGSAGTDSGESKPAPALGGAG